MRSTAKYVFSFVAAILFAVPAFCQEGTVSGRVLDRDGKPMVGVTISIDRKEFTQHYETKTDKKGEYSYSGIDNGLFKVTVLQDGVSVAGRDNFKLSFGDRVPLDFDLREQVDASGGRMDKAQKDAENIANIETQGVFNAGVEAYNAGKNDEALKQFLAAAEKRPNIPVIFARLGSVYSEMKQYNEAADAYQKASDLKPGDTNYLTRISTSACRAGQVERCRAAVAKAVEIDPSVGGTAYYNAGILLLDQGKPSDAAEAFQKSIAHNNKNADAYFQLGMAYLGSEKTIASSVPQFEKFLQLAPKSANAQAAKDLIEAAKASSSPPSN